MGLFSSLFGNSNSDQAQKDRQNALNAFNSVKTPELQALQVQLQQEVSAGKLTPQQAEASLLNSNAFNNITTDPNNTAAQKQALTALQATASAGGLTAIDKAQLQDITNAQNQEAQGRNAAITQNLQERGIGGSGLELTSKLANEQQAADTASQRGTDVAAQAQARALAAITGAGTLGGQMEAQQYGEQANKAQAQNAIDVFNANTKNQFNMANTQEANAAQEANLQQQQALNERNTATANANKEYNAQQNQTQFQDALSKAQGVAGVEQNAATAEQEQKNKELGAETGLIGGALGAAGTIGGAMVGGPVGAAAGSQVMKPPSYAPQTEDQLPMYEGGKVEDPNANRAMTEEEAFDDFCRQLYSKGGKVKDPHFLEGLKKGALHKELGVSQDKKIPAKKLEKATHSDNETLRKRAQFAENAKHWHHNSQGGVVGYCEGGVCNYKDGGFVPGIPKVPGDSPVNDTVKAKLSPGEVVLPRSIAGDPDAASKFVKSVNPNPKEEERDLMRKALGNISTKRGY